MNGYAKKGLKSNYLKSKINEQKNPASKNSEVLRRLMHATKKTRNTRTSPGRWKLKHKSKTLGSASYP